MKLTEIHRVLKFKQSDGMKMYIDFKTKKEEMQLIILTKILLNGKAMENLRKRINVRLVSNARDFLKYTSRPIYITRKIFDEDYATILEIKPILMLNEPIYVGLK